MYRFNSTHTMPMFERYVFGWRSYDFDHITEIIVHKFGTSIAGCTSASVLSLSLVNLTVSAWLNEMVL